MINIQELDKPQVLETNTNTWTRDLMSYVIKGLPIPASIKNRYRHPDIKDKVKEETNEKCVYCESQITHQYPGDIEHIIPKSEYPILTFYWPNLTFVCYWCNNHKRDYVGKGDAKLLNPYKDNIDDHLEFFGPLVMHLNKSKRGEITWRKIKLNRKELVDKRIDKIQELQNLIDKYERENVPALKDILLDEILEFSNSDKEYARTCIGYLKAKNIL